MRPVTHKTDYPDSLRPSIEAPGVYELEVEIDGLPLTTAHYSLDFACRSGDSYRLGYLCAIEEIRRLQLGPEVSREMVIT